MADRIIREAECKNTSGLSRSTRWRQERKGQFPRRRKISDNAVGWVHSEIQEWLKNREEALSRKVTEHPQQTTTGASRPTSRGKKKDRRRRPTTREKEAGEQLDNEPPTAGGGRKSMAKESPRNGVCPVWGSR